MKYCWFWIGIVSWLASCSDTEVTPPGDVKTYLPLKVGAFYIYSVEETVTQTLTGEIKSSYELKTWISDSVKNTDGSFTYVIQRFKRNDSAGPWANLPTWSARVNRFQAIVNEENKGYLKIEGPIAEGKEWNGNLPNSMDEDKYTMAEVNKSFTPDGSMVFPVTVTIVQNDNKDLIVFQDKRSEVYAENIGLVYREILQLEYCTAPNCLGQQEVIKGLAYKQTLTEYGGL